MTGDTNITVTKQDGILILEIGDPEDCRVLIPISRGNAQALLLRLQQAPAVTPADAKAKLLAWPRENPTGGDAA